MISLFQFHRRNRDRRSSALIITLIVLLLVTLLIVSLTSMIGIERNSTHESFEAQRAREFSQIAVDEVVALLHDNIPNNSMWAAAPGMLAFYTNSLASSATIVNLFSGTNSSPTSSTGEVNLNAPVLGTVSTYPIIPINPEFPAATPMLMGWIEVVQDTNSGAVTLIRPPATSNQDKTKQVIGRYAYWVDTETSKVNINAAGKGQSAYNFDPTNFMNGSGNVDSQNLTGSPSRADLSQLDGGITPNQSSAVYHYTYGGYFLPTGLGDYLGSPVYSVIGAAGITAPFPSLPTNGPGMTAQGMQRFSSIQDLTQLTTDLIAGANTFSPITAAQVDMNKFYLTVRSSAPDVTPWGFNRMWLQANDVKQEPLSGLTTRGPTSGNIANGHGIPFFPSSLSSSQTNIPNWNDQYFGIGSAVGDTRYYVTPFYANGSKASGPFTNDFQVMGEYESGTSLATSFLNNMMAQLNRTDWPGFAGKSFVQKYGQRECEDLAYNILCLYDNTLVCNSIAPTFRGTSHGPLDPQRPDSAGTNVYIDGAGIYGADNMVSIDGTNRLMGGVGEFPYLSQLSVGFQPSFSGNNLAAVTTVTTNIVGALTNVTTNVAPLGGNAYAGKFIITNTANGSNTFFYTKFTNGPGFSPNFSSGLYAHSYYYASGKTPINIDIKPQAILMYPRGFKNPYPIGGPNGQAGQSETLVDIEVYANGTYFGTNITYGTAATNLSPVVDTSYGNTISGNNINHPYYFGCIDAWNDTNGENANTPSGIGERGGNSSQGPLAHSNGNADGFTSVAFPDIYIGPFDQGTIVSDVQFRCRFAQYQSNGHTMRTANEIAPLGVNSYINEDQAFTNVVCTNASINPTYAPTFLFEATNVNLANTGTASIYTYSTVDPRVYRYLTDWTYAVSGIQYPLPGTPPNYFSAYTDPVTGVQGDDSKFAWPDIGLDYYNLNISFYHSTTNSVREMRSAQFGNNIEAFPGIGWLSVLPLNCESSQGSTATDGSGGGGSGISVGTPIPWRTLSLEASKTSQLPDWLLMEAFAVAYDQTYCSQTQGKMNVNETINPFGFVRTKPLAALIQPSSYAASADNPSLPATAGTTIASALANGPASSDYSAPPGAVNLPNNIFMYPGQLCQVSDLTASGADQWRRESLMRNIFGAITTQCNDYKVHVVSQAVKQVSYSGDPTADLKVTAEQRMSAIVSRVPNLGPDNLPDTGDEPPHMTAMTNAQQSVPTGVPGITNSFIVTTPTYKYIISDLDYVNN